MKHSRVLAIVFTGTLVVAALFSSTLLVSKPATLAEAKITWSVPKLSATMFPGTTSTTTVTFSSSETFTNVIVEGTPSLKDVLSINPTSFASISANRIYTVTFTFKAPSEFKKSDFGGTIHLRNAGTPSKTFAQPLEFELKSDWNSTGTTLGIRSISYPTSWFWLKDTNGMSFSNVQTNSPLSQHALQTEADFQIGIIKNINPSGLPIEQWFDKQFSAFGNEIYGRVSTAVGGRPAVQIQVSEIGRRVHIYVPSNTDVLEISYGVYAPAFLDTYQSIVGSIQF